MPPQDLTHPLAAGRPTGIPETILGLISDTALIVLDEDLHILVMEGELFRRHGYDAEGSIGRDVREVIVARAWGELGGHWQAALEGTSRTIDVTSVDGSREYCLHFAPLETAPGRPHTVCMVAQDITERTRGRAALQRRLDQQSAVTALAALEVEDAPLEAILEESARLFAQATGATTALILEDLPSGPCVTASWGEGAAPDPAALGLRTRLLVSDLELGPPQLQGLAQDGRRSLVGSPIGSPEANYGYLLAAGGHPGLFAEADGGFADTVASMVMAAVQRTRATASAADTASRTAEFWELSLDLLAVVSPEGRFLEVGGAWERTLGWTATDLVGESALHFMAHEDRAAAITQAGAVAASGGVHEIVNDYRARDGSVHTLLWSARKGPDGSLYAAAKDITERHAERELMRTRTAQLNEAQRLAGLGSWEIDLRSGEYELSENMRELYELDTCAPGFALIASRVHPDDRSRVDEGRAAATTGGPIDGEFRLLLPSGKVRLLHGSGEGIRDDDGELIGLRGTARDITDERHSEQALRLSEARFRQGFDNAPIGMALSDPVTLRFLRVNAALCRMLGRTAEELVGSTFTSVTHPDDIADAHEGAGALNAGDRDQHIAEKRYLHADGRSVWTSINISVVRDQDQEADVFFAQMVDITERKEREEVLRAQLSDLSWLGDITRAIAEDRFELHAQPIVELNTRAVVQTELLLRLRAPGGELVAPADFLPAAEKYGSVREIDRWVISRGAELASRGQNVEINLSAVSLGDPGLIAHIVDELARTDADPARMVFEITETALLRSAETAIHLASQLRTRGCRFALDDFGTGYAGFHYLKALPLDFLKIDREFVRDPVTHAPDPRVIEAVVGLARGFGLRTIAEGVEDEATLKLLERWGVDFAQGYYLGHPAPLELG